MIKLIHLLAGLLLTAVSSAYETDTPSETDH